MTALKRRKKKSSPKRRELPEYDRYWCYRNAVQAPDVDCDFISNTYRELRGRRPRVLREDFCAAFAICCEWAKKHRENQAIGIDLDPEPLAYGRAHYLSELKEEQQKRVRLIEGSVLTTSAPKADVIAALNFSYFLFKSRLMLRQYFKRARAGLKRDGILILDCFGGSACQSANEETTQRKGFKYFWDQTSFNPITYEALFHIHFQRDGEKKREKQFEYDWRLWTIPEIRETLSEAGFSKTHVYWEGTNRRGGGNGVFKRTEEGEDCEAWIAYIAAEP